MKKRADFVLDSRLENDCEVLGVKNDILILRLENALFDWIILVPKTDVKQLHLLPQKERLNLESLIQSVSEIFEKKLSPDRLNVASIGNVVSQLHVHIVARYETDPAWPGVVWGFPEKKELTSKQREKMSKILTPILDSKD